MQQFGTLTSLLFQRLITITFFALVLTACSNRNPPSETEVVLPDSTSKLYVVASKNHIGIVVDNRFVDFNLWPQFSQYQHFRFIEFDWGEKSYSLAKDPGILAVWKALFIPTDGIVSFTAFNERDPYFKDKGQREWRAFAASASQINDVLTLINNKITYDQDKQWSYVRDARWGTGLIVESNEKYSLGNLCGDWVNSLLKILDIPPPHSMTFWPSAFMEHLRPYSHPFEPNKS